MVLWFKWLFRKWRLQWEFRGKKLTIGYMSYINECKFGINNVIYDNIILSKVAIDNYSYISANCVFQNTTIGKFCSIGPNVKAGLGNHLVDEYVSTHPAFFTNDDICKPVITFVNQTYFDFLKPIVIGNDVWIGANAIIMDGVSIGDGAIIGAGAIVTRDVPPYAIVAGIPAKILRYRFNEEQIEFMLKSQWWNKDLEWLEKNAGIFLDVAQFTCKFNEK